MQEHLTAFELECKSKNLQPKTLAFYTWQLGQFQACIATQGITRIEDIQKAAIQRYLVYQKERGLKDRSVHASFRAIRTFFNFLEAEGWIARQGPNGIYRATPGRQPVIERYLYSDSTFGNYWAPVWSR